MIKLKELLNEGVSLNGIDFTIHSNSNSHGPANLITFMPKTESDRRKLNKLLISYTTRRYLIRWWNRVSKWIWKWLTNWSRTWILVWNWFIEWWKHRRLKLNLK